MPSIGLFVLGLALAAAATLGTMRVTYVVLIGTLVLVPGTLPVPNGFSSYLLVHNLVIVGALLAVVRGVRDGSIDRSHLRVTPLQVALGVFCAIGLVNGMALAGPSTVLTGLQHGMVDLLAQLAILTIALVLVRAIDDHRLVIGTLAAALVLSCGIAVIEHVTGQSYGHFLFHSQKIVTDAAEGLTKIGNRPPRVRAGAEFPLQFAWIAVALVPAFLVALTFIPRRLAWWSIVPAATIILGVYWSYSRSPVAVLPLALLAVWAGLRWHRRITIALAILAAGVALVVVTQPSVTNVLKPSADVASINSRSERLPLVGEDLIGHSLQGIGFGGLRLLAINATDASYVQVFAELGVIGLAAFAALLVIALVSTGRGLRGPPGPARSLATVGFAGVLVAVAGSASFDLFAVRSSSGLFWIFAAIGTVGAEQARGFLPAVQRPTMARVGVAGVGVVLSFAVFFLVPPRASTTTRFLVTPVSAEAVSGTGFLSDLELGNTACGIVTSFPAPSGSATWCREIRAGRGVREMRIESSNRSQLAAVQRDLTEQLQEAVPTIRFYPVTIGVVSRPTASRTAPIWGTWLVLSLVAFLPGIPVRATLRRWSDEGWAGARQPARIAA